MKDRAKLHRIPTEQRVFEEAIATLECCSNLTYLYVEDKRFGIETILFPLKSA